MNHEEEDDPGAEQDNDSESNDDRVTRRHSSRFGDTVAHAHTVVSPAVRNRLLRGHIVCDEHGLGASAHR